MAACLTTWWLSVQATFRSKLVMSSSKSKDAAPSMYNRCPRAAQQWRRMRGSGSVISGFSMVTVLLASSVHLCFSSSFTPSSIAKSPTAIYLSQMATVLQAARRTDTQGWWRESITCLKKYVCGGHNVTGLNGSKFPKSLHAAALTLQ